MSDHIKIELPIAVVEPLFTALHNIKATNHTRLEMKAISMLRTALTFELEQMMETPEELEQRQLDFKELFHKERLRREYKERERAF